MPDLKRIPLRGSWDAPTRKLSLDTTADEASANDQGDATYPV